MMDLEKLKRKKKKDTILKNARILKEDSSFLKKHGIGFTLLVNEAISNLRKKIRDGK